MTDFVRLSLDGFLTALSSEEPTPGGGTAAAVAGAMGAALVEMVAALTLGKEKFADAHEAVRPIAQAASAARRELLGLAGEDSRAFDAVMAARKLPKETDQDKARRSSALAESNRAATEVPMRTARAAALLLASLPELVQKGQPQRRLGRGHGRAASGSVRRGSAAQRRDQPVGHQRRALCRADAEGDGAIAERSAASALPRARRSSQEILTGEWFSEKRPRSRISLDGGAPVC